MHEFLNNRSKGFAYTPIVASGNNANVLHYIENNQQCKAGELITTWMLLPNTPTILATMTQNDSSFW